MQLCKDLFLRTLCVTIVDCTGLNAAIAIPAIATNWWWQTALPM
jgi:hypothetical protein